VVSVLDTGSTFTIYLPRAAGPAERQPIGEAPGTDQSASVARQVRKRLHGADNGSPGLLDVCDPRLYRDPYPGVRCIRFAAHCYFDAIHHNEKLVSNFFDLHRGLFRHLELAAFRIIKTRSARRLANSVAVRHRKGLAFHCLQCDLLREQNVSHGQTAVWRETPFRDGVARWSKLQDIQRSRVTDPIAVAGIASSDFKFATARPLLELFGGKPGSQKC
jgi:hypothetical protein